MTNAERQAAYKARQRELGRKPVTMLLTDDEQFWLERVLLRMRHDGATPAMVRLKNGRMQDMEER